MAINDLNLSSAPALADLGPPALTDLMYIVRPGSPALPRRTALSSLLGSGPVVSVYNVKSSPYLAVGDGVANDTAAIQAAIDACNTAGGGIVYMPPGTYQVAHLPHPESGSYYAALLLRSNVMLIGAGAGATTIKVANAQSHDGAMVITSAEINNVTLAQKRVVLADFAIDGNNANQSNNNQTGINLWRMRDVIVQRVTVRNIWATAGAAAGWYFEAQSSADILFSECLAELASGTSDAIGFFSNGTTNIKFSNCIGRSCFSGFIIDNSAQVQFDNCNAYYGTQGFTLEISDRVVLTNCIAGGKTSRSGGTAVLADNTEIGPSTYGITVNGCTDVQICGGLSRVSGGTGLTITNAAGACDNIHVDGLNLDGCTTPYTLVGTTNTNITFSNCAGLPSFSGQTFAKSINNNSATTLAVITLTSPWSTSQVASFLISVNGEGSATRAAHIYALTATYNTGTVTEIGTGASLSMTSYTLTVAVNFSTRKITLTLTQVNAAAEAQTTTIAAQLLFASGAGIAWTLAGT